jgi:hypothetical protein
MYEAKGRQSDHIHFVCVRLEQGELVEIRDDQPALPLRDQDQD